MTNKQKAYARITISVLQARNLKAADRNGLSDPYVVVTQGKHFETTKTIKENLNPTWNETFVFTPEGNDSAMLIKVFDKDMASDDLIGKADLVLKPTHQPEETWYPLAGSQGEILLRTHFVTIDSLLHYQKEGGKISQTAEQQSAQLAAELDGEKNQVAGLKTSLETAELDSAKATAALEEEKKKNEELKAEIERLSGSVGNKVQSGVGAGVGKVKGLFKK